MKETSHVDLGDLLDYLALDPATSAILLYVEAITRARKFMSAARAAARLKPVIVLKACRHAPRMAALGARLVRAGAKKDELARLVSSYYASFDKRARSPARSRPTAVVSRPARFAGRPSVSARRSMRWRPRTMQDGGRCSIEHRDGARESHHERGGGDRRPDPIAAEQHRG